MKILPLQEAENSIPHVTELHFTQITHTTRMPGTTYILVSRIAQLNKYE